MKIIIMKAITDISACLCGVCCGLLILYLINSNDYVMLIFCGFVCFGGLALWLYEKTIKQEV